MHTGTSAWPTPGAPWGYGIAAWGPSPRLQPPWLTPCPPPKVHSLQELRRSASLATKVFVQRDYSDGTTCQFQTKFPPELESRVGNPVVCVCGGGEGALFSVSCGASGV